ncbi:MAG: clostripain-related cysteine peptidase [Candidatus Eremiobacteraeota bacterium]|nr:clostripain-related cysteine peptidase [Candidatus Eremiobacteraeota bacterium]
MDIRPTGGALEHIQFEKPGKPAQNETAPQPAGDQVSLGTGQDQVVKKKWTFLHYGAGDNNLSQYIMRDADEAESIGSDANTHLVSQLDMSSGTCKRYHLQKDPAGVNGKMTSPVLQDMGSKVDMSDPKTLTDFLVWGQKNFPSDFVGVSIGDHGGGTAGAISDDRDGGYGMMSPADLKKAFADAEAITGKKIDVLGFDCCLMANTEVAYELKDVTNYMVASEETEGGLGWPYNNVLNDKVLSSLQEALRHKINVDPKEFATKIVADAEQVQGDLPTMSTIDMSKMGDVAAKVDGFAKAIIASEGSAGELKSLAGRTQSFGEFKDVYDFCQKVAGSQNLKDESLKTAAKDVMASLDKAILANQHSNAYPGAHGLQIELPSWGGLSGKYQDLQFAKDTSWDEAMGKISKTEVPAEPSAPSAPPSGGYEFGFDEY